MIHKLNTIVEPLFVLIAISLQPLIGIISGVAAFAYYTSMLKMNIVDKKHDGSWKKYFKSIIKINFK